MKLQTFFILLMLMLHGIDSLAQNVGIGTTTPANKLSVNGNADITGKVGIGTTSLTGQLNVKSLYTGNEALDVNIDNFNLIYGGPVPPFGGTWHQWQSFTADTTGVLVKVGLRLKSPLGNSTPSPCTIKIYQGEGTSVLLATVSVTLQALPNSYQTYDIPNVPVTDGSKYTVYWEVPNVTANWIYVSTANPYDGGRAGYDISENDEAEDCDVNIKTYLKPTNNVDALLVNNGNVYIGSNDNHARLRISADDSALPALSISGKGEFQVDTVGVAGGRFIVKNNGRVGIGTSDPITKLDVNGGIRTKYSGSVVLGIPAGSSTQNITIPPLPTGWDFSNTFVSVVNVDGSPGVIKQVKLTSSTNISFLYVQDITATSRFNWIIFKL